MSPREYKRGVSDGIPRKLYMKATEGYTDEIIKCEAPNMTHQVKIGNKAQQLDDRKAFFKRLTAY